MSNTAAKLPAGISGRNRIASMRNGPLYSGIWGSSYFDVNLRRKILKDDIVEEIGKDLYAPEKRSLALMPKSSSVVDSLTRLDFQQLLPDDYLVKVDRASMANSLEVRTPFLDHNLICIQKIPGSWKCNLSERRRIQNLMAKNFLPKEFEINRKQGFSVPMDAWIKDISIDKITDGISSDIFNLSYINDLLIGQQRENKWSEIICFVNVRHIL